ncbi:DUF2332 domain-containing protein [Rhizobium oryziradicis]|uniref:DUF2332 domain-containing protein n=1 Tax=Rhizobium oryziradicis TaxID=1867956 RepID=A0A1Q8ZQ24_9HYPH|nr:DUF2332 family protein [Rhizobium oryziradicis]OLP44032.1 hypothetical protein BJF95_05495 [Rhizobium oryziradicis]
MANTLSIRDSFLDQARSCEALGSPFNARLCRLVAAKLEDNNAVANRILSWPGDTTSAGDSVPLRLAGTLHALVLNGLNGSLARVYPPHHVDDDALWAAVSQALVENESFIQERLNSAPQTNEVRRSAALLPGFLTLASLFGLPLKLSEVGASAGLNLQWDRYRYQLADFIWGGPSKVTLAPEWQGASPPFADITVAERAGCDLNPLDPTSSEDQMRLFSYIWPDQTDRLERTKAALDIATNNNLSVTRADAIEWLKTRLTQPHDGLIHVIYNSVAWQYLPDRLKAEGEALIQQAGQHATMHAPLAHLQMEADGKRGAALSLQIWPNGEKREIGRADFHGRWINWAGWTP